MSSSELSYQCNEAARCKPNATSSCDSCLLITSFSNAVFMCVVFLFFPFLRGSVICMHLRRSVMLPGRVFSEPFLYIYHLIPVLVLKLASDAVFKVVQCFHFQSIFVWRCIASCNNFSSPMKVVPG